MSPFSSRFPPHQISGFICFWSLSNFLGSLFRMLLLFSQDYVLFLPTSWFVCIKIQFLQFPFCFLFLFLSIKQKKKFKSLGLEQRRRVWLYIRVGKCVGKELVYTVVKQYRSSIWNCFLYKFLLRPSECWS